MKHYKSVEFLSNVNVKAPLHKCKAPRTNGKPYWRLSGDGSGLTAVPAYLKKSAKLFVVVRYFVPDIVVKVKLSEFKSLQVKLLQYIAKIATYSKQDMNHICLKARCSEASRFSITKIWYAYECMNCYFCFTLRLPRWRWPVMRLQTHC